MYCDVLLRHAGQRIDRHNGRMAFNAMLYQGPWDSNKIEQRDRRVVTVFTLTR